MTDTTDHSAVVVHDGFAVRDATSANWVVRKVVEARAYAQRVEAWSELELRRAQREEDFLLRRFGAELEAWARQQIAHRHDGRSTVNLPAGTVGFRAEPTKLCVVDEPKLLAWCRVNLPSAIRTVESVPKTPLMDHVKATGECPAGTEITGGGQRFHITAKNLKSTKQPPAKAGGFVEQLKLRIQAKARVGRLKPAKASRRSP